MTDELGADPRTWSSTPPASAYGTLCGMVPVMLGLLIEGITAAAESLHDTGARLRAAAADHEATDQQRAQVMDAIPHR
jgi:hypothetical protein